MKQGKQRSTKTRSLVIPNTLDDRITMLMAEKDRSRSYIMLKLLEMAIENMERFPIVIESRPVKGGKK